MNNIIKSIQELKIVLPEAAKPVANYSPYVLIKYNICFWANSFQEWNFAYKGKVGKDINIDEAIKASEICLINTLAVLNLATNNNFNKIKSCIKINVFINSSEDFIEQPELQMEPPT